MKSVNPDMTTDPDALPAPTQSSWQPAGKDLPSQPEPAISLIVAMDENQAIGKGGGLAWHIKDDLRFFKKTTRHSAIIMGRKTYESIGWALPDRFNIILTRDRSYKADHCLVTHTRQAALSAAKAYCFAAKRSEIFITGGAEIYAQYLDICARIYLTQIATCVEGADTFFPPINDRLWTRQRLGEIAASRDNEFVGIIDLLEKQPVKVL